MPVRAWKAGGGQASRCARSQVMIAAYSRPVQSASASEGTRGALAEGERWSSHFRGR